MSKFFGNDTVGKIEDMLGGETPIEEEAPQEVVAESAPSQPESSDDDSSEAADVKPTESQVDVSEAKPSEAAVEGVGEPLGMSDDGSTSDGSHRVPYNRFKQVIDARNQLRGERDTLSRQMEELAAQVEALKSKGVEAHAAARPDVRSESYDPVPVPEFLTEEEQAYFQSMQQGFQQRYSGLENRLQAYELHMAQQSLESQISKAVEKYPDVPRRAILEAVASDGSANVMDVAERYSSFVNQLREEAIANYLAEHGEPPASEVVEKKAAPRPARTSGSVASPAISPEKKTRSLKDANKALHKFLETNNIF